MDSPAQPVRFLIDHMVIRLGKYLRVIGCDAEWDLGLSTRELIQRANAEGRVFITRNRRLSEQYPAAKTVFVMWETDPVKQFRELLRRFSMGPCVNLFRKCIRCNVHLDEVADKQSIRARVHPNVFARHDRFFTCSRCGTVFWHGSHVTNTCRKLGLKRPNR